MIHSIESAMEYIGQDHSVPFAQEESGTHEQSFYYPPTSSTHQYQAPYSPHKPGDEFYANPQSVGSVMSLASEQGPTVCTDPGYANDVEGGGEETQDIPAFMKLLEEDTPDRSQDGSSGYPVFTQFTSIQNVINTRDKDDRRHIIQMEQYLKNTDEKPKTPVSTINQGNVIQCSGVEDFDMVLETMKAEAGDAPSCLVPEEYEVIDVPTGKQAKKRKYSETSTRASVCGLEDENLTDAERDRRERRKASNRRAAKKCREKKMKEQSDIIQAKEECVARLDRLERENTILRQIVANCPSCRSHPAVADIFMPQLGDPS